MRDAVEKPRVVGEVMEKPVIKKYRERQTQNPEDSDQEGTDNKEEESEVIGDKEGKEEEQKKRKELFVQGR